MQRSALDQPDATCAIVSWAERAWALPFLTVLAPSERYCEQQGRRRKKITDWARQMLFQLSRWLPRRLLVIVADSSYAALELLRALKDKVSCITRLRLDAARYDSAPEKQAGKRGRNRLKGEPCSKPISIAFLNSNCITSTH